MWFLANKENDKEYLTLRLIFCESLEHAIRFDTEESAMDFVRNNLPDDGLRAVLRHL